MVITFISPGLGPKTHLDSGVFLNLARLEKIVVRGSRLVIKIVVRSRGVGLVPKVV